MNPLAFFSRRWPGSPTGGDARDSDSARPARRGFAAALALLAAACLAPAADSPYGIANSKHNLSVTGTGAIHSSSEAEICIFCHAPHTDRAQPALWNHRQPASAYTPYSSSTMRATVGQPTGSSKLCLSCHDGTVAIGMVANRPNPIPMSKGTTVMPAGPSRFGTDLSSHHPISFTYDSALATVKGELRDPLTLKQQVQVDKQRQMQCTSCHDPHDNQYGKFLVKDNSQSALCLDCHAPNQWSSSAHATSPATWNGTGRNPWAKSAGATVAANGCGNCHTPHGAGTKPHLLNFAKAEDNCLICHNGTLAQKNIASEVTKVSAHSAIAIAPVRDTTMSPLAAIDTHVSCVDCHNPHATATAAVVTGGLPGSLARVRGVSAGGASMQVATREYEVCFRCHAGSAALSRSSVARQFPQPNTRLEFSPANVSYHPVLAAAKNPRDQTLITPWTTASQMLCQDCHNNDQGPGANGSGPKGPHGSRYAPLLERNLVQEDFQPENATAYAMCYKCHNQSVLMADRLHSRHVRDDKTSCSTCHDAHGVQSQGHLINFNTIYVRPFNGQINYTDLGGGRANCTLSCHGKDHDPTKLEFQR